MRTLELALRGGPNSEQALPACSIPRRVVLDEEQDPLLVPARVWESITPYLVTRHLSKSSPADVLARNIKAECSFWGLPEPEVCVRNFRGIAGAGLEGDVRLKFRAAVPGSILLGQSRHVGGGLFSGVPAVRDNPHGHDRGLTT